MLWIKVNENEVFAIVTVTCHTGNGGTPFTVDYDFTDITAVGGIDYNNTGGTLNFNGNDGDTANIVVGIIDNDSVGEVYETFQINLLNPSPTAGSPDLTKKGIGAFGKREVNYFNHLFNVQREDKIYDNPEHVIEEKGARRNVELFGSTASF